VLMAYADPKVAESAERYELSPEALLDGGRHTAYICAPTHEQQRLRPILTAVVQEIIAAVYERASRTGKPLDPPLLLVLDECANIAPLRELASLASTGAGQGIQLVSVFQDLAQVASVYGRDRASTIVSNHRAKIILTGISDSSTLDYVSRLLGDEEVRLTSSTSGGEGRRSTTESSSYRSLAPSHVLRQMSPGEGVLVYGHLSPTRLKLRPWYEEKSLLRLAAAPGRR
jgi:type IV secretion system protein VirD4